VRAEQTVSEMVVESLARRAEALSEESGQSFEEAFADVLKTPPAVDSASSRTAPTATRRPQSGRPACWPTARPGDRRLRTSEGGYEVGEDSLSWQGRYMDWVEGTDGREEYDSFLRNRFASLEG
jgi:hypothetical protein